MGTLVGRIAVLVVALALFAPGGAHADTTWYEPGDYALGPAGGSPNATMVSQDTDTGELQAFQFQFTAVSGSLGCTGQGPYAYFDVAHSGDVDQVTVEFDEAIVSPYAFLKVSLLDGETFLATKSVRGPFLLDGSVVGPGTNSFTLTLDEPVDGDLTARVGIEVSSNCPSVDGGRVIISRVGFASA